MQASDKIKFYLGIFKDLSTRDIFSFLKAARTRKLAAGDIYIREGETGARLAFIRKGIIRAYHVNEQGEELTLMLRWEDQFIASHENIIFNRPSRFIYEAVEETTLLEADYATIMRIIDSNPVFEKSRYYFLLHMLGEAMTRMESFVLLSPEERYLQLIREKPDLVQRVPGKHLATLLGITPVSLSRIRKRIAARSKH